MDSDPAAGFGLRISTSQPQISHYGDLNHE